MMTPSGTPLGICHADTADTDPCSGFPEAIPGRLGTASLGRAGEMSLWLTRAIRLDPWDATTP